MKFYNTKKEYSKNVTIRSGRKGGRVAALDRYIAANARLAAKRNPPARSIADARDLAKSGIAWRRQVADGVAYAQGRCNARTVSAGTVHVAIIEAAKTGLAQQGTGGRPGGSYGYSYTTTSYTAASSRDGASIQYTVRRSESVYGRIDRRAVIRTSACANLLGGAVIAVQKTEDCWYCFNADLSFAHYAYRVTDQTVMARFGKWEHAANRKVADAETRRKRELIDSEIAAKKASERQAKRAERAARLLSRISTKPVVTFADARAMGACEAGIKAFAAKIGKPLDAKVSLAEIAAIEPTWAVRLARRALQTAG